MRTKFLTSLKNRRAVAVRKETRLAGFSDSEVLAFVTRSCTRHYEPAIYSPLLTSYSKRQR
jgi:hypothetical protein